jgi:acyl carrier protein
MSDIKPVTIPRAGVVYEPSQDERIDDIIMRELSVEPREIGPKAKLTDDLGADSLDIAEMTIALEEEFVLPDYALQDEADRMNTVGDVRKLVEKAIKKTR